ncbi:bifunctional adenosylcobinamide kinase/adenosylcobinamide-phosphate guanylyltransferase [Aneurinibacillus terranovensis]|uniref:bifunctional adenosylcobinamide kinase/adenosylcobinamide-phosphate guanylyltransferase n=1 Tax=Aneurinibacillus terranovensis TaxID=278991 RepID=UPI0003FC9DA1|nr:bifunctional adenosylcobinamide kinase/adenosylcobinamide-phosphate guanylyltransferase [Aneurinibacillus terranovensis]
MSLILVTGGVRSGKSAFAERIARETSDSVLYVATGVCTDSEMEQRIEYHQKRRPVSWGLLESSDSLGSAEVYDGFDVILIDCLSTWISNALLTVPEDSIRDSGVTKRILNDTADWISLIQTFAGTVILVSTEAGLGGVAMSRLGRWFQDVLGEANQQIARAADEVYAVISGIPWQIKGEKR